MTACLEALKRIQRTIGEPIRRQWNKGQVLLSMEGRVLSTYKEESVRWPELEGARKVTRYKRNVR